MSTYFKNISLGITTTVTGLRLTLRHLWNARKRRKNLDIRSGDFYSENEGMVTVQYPMETVPIPDNGRYRLHNEIDDCIVCDKCVKVCPVDCIEIEPIKAVEEVGRASDGSPIRLYAARFDIDMAKCCYCGLCTTVCPTECLTMTKTFDYSELDVRDMVYNYTNLTPEQADEKRALLEQFQKEKEALKAAKTAATPAVEPTEKPAAAPRPVFKPTAKPKPAEEATVTPEAKPAERPKPVFKPTAKPKPAEPQAESIEEKPAADPVAARPKPVFKPTIKPKPAPAVEEPIVTENKIETSEQEQVPAPAKPAFRPTMKPKVAAPGPGDNNEIKKEEAPQEPAAEEPKAAPAKPAFRPTMKPKPRKDEE